MKKRRDSHGPQERVSEAHDELDAVVVDDLKMKADHIGLFVDDQILFADDYDLGVNERGALASTDDDLLQFTDDDLDPEYVTTHPHALVDPWQILVVDDDPDVLSVTRLALSRLEVNERALELHVAHSAAEARRLLQTRDDFALMISDVVMESDQAGLELISWARTQRQHQHMRIVIRTGEPGQAPEERVLQDLDINDYWPKTELIAPRMRTLVIGLVRSYRDLVRVEEHKNQLHHLVDAMGELIAQPDLKSLMHSAVQLINRVVRSRGVEVIFLELLSQDHPSRVRILAGTGRFQMLTSELKRVDQVFNQRLSLLLTESRAQEGLVERHHAIARSLTNAQGQTVAFMIRKVTSLDQARRDTLLSLCTHILSLINAQQHHDARERLARSVGRFVPTGLVSWLGCSDITELGWGDRQMTQAWVMFCDIKGFTKRSERLGPDGVHRFLLEIYQSIVPCIERHGGSIDKFLGDGLMGLFPMSLPPPLQCCLEIKEEISKLAREQGAPLSLGVGVHGGEVLLCTLGHQDRIDITAVADAVNVASRIEQLTRAYACEVLVSERVVQALSPDDPLRAHLVDRGLAELRGRHQKIRVFQI